MVQTLTSLEKEMKEYFTCDLVSKAVIIDEDGQIDEDSILFEFVIAQADILKTLVEKIESLEKENSEMECKLQEIFEKCQKLSDIGANRLKRMMGQFAFKIERAVVDRVLDGLIDSDEYVATIADMEKAINGKPNYIEIFKTEKDRESAEKAWIKLKQELRWTGKHFRYVQELKEHYMPTIACRSNIEILQQMIAYGNSQIKDKELFMELLEISKTLSI